MTTTPEQDDLAAARSASQRLAERQTKVPSTDQPAPHPPYTRFKRATGSAVAAPAPSPHASSEPKNLPPLPDDLDLEGFGGRSWEQLLRWVCEASGTQGAFAVDGRGLPIAHVGEIPHLNTMGPRIALSFDQAARMAPGSAPSAITIDLGTEVVTGLWIGAITDRRVTLGLVGAEAPAEAVRDRIRQLLEQKLGLSG